MRISYNWVKEYLDIDLDPYKIAEILTNIGLEIEGTEEWCSVQGSLDGIVVGEVLSSSRHPNADKLTVNLVDIGAGDPLSIVCGAPNVAKGQKVPVALAGSVVFKGEEQLEIKKSKIRGELSEGMICAEDEIGMGASHEGIMVLDSAAKPGTPAVDYFKAEKDFIFEIGLTPNRIDSGSHYGVARDLFAYLTLNENLDIKLKLPSVKEFKPDKTKETFEIIIENKKDCPRYTGVNIYDVNVSESPDWLKNRLLAAGLTPINNVVDITNYVQHEIGQPLHAFDADMIEGNKVIIRNLPDKSHFVTLDEADRELSARDLMICNEREGMCIAGVFGGIKSGVTSKTRNVFLESAYFNPVSIRKTARRHGLNTDASYRFERGADPEITDWALKRASLLIRELANGKISADFKDIYPEKIRNASIDVRFSNIDRLIGKKIDKDIIKRIIGLLDIKIISSTTDTMSLEIPARKVDVHKEADVIEEILRIYGYNNVEINNHVNSTLTYIPKPDKEKVVNLVSDLLTSNGFAEIMCNSLTPAAWYTYSSSFDKKKLVMLANPLSSDLNSMRQTLLFGGLNSIAWNINRQNHDLKLYEFGNCYFLNSGQGGHDQVKGYYEKTDLDLFITGHKGKPAWNNPSTPVDFFYLKSFVEMVLARVGIKPEKLVIDESHGDYFSESLSYSVNNKIIAEAGRISRKLLKRFDIEQDVFYGHIVWDYLLQILKNHKIQYAELPKFPAVRRDLALLVSKNIRFSEIRELAFKTERNLIKDVGLFDVYESELLGRNKKSYAVSFTLQDEFRTMTDKNIDRIMNNLIRVFEKELGAQIRK